MGHALLFVVLIAGCGQKESDPETDEQAVTGGPPLVASSSIGALDGMFAVSDEGAATYTIPFDSPAGRAGIEPELSLVYSSNGGNSLSGVGWSLSGFSQIARCARTFWHDGEDRPMQFTARDNFCLDGARLVVVGQDAAVTAAGCASSRKIEYRTEPDSFAKIVACGEDVAGPLEWFVFRKDGRIDRYGSASGRMDVTARKPDDDGNDGGTELRRPFWLCDRVEDRIGNYMTVTYGRTTAADQLEWWPERIDYTGFGTTDAPNRSVVFKYGFDVEDQATPRPDAWITYLRGIELPHTRILKTVTMFAPSPDVQPLSHVRKYLFSYTRSASTQRALLGAATVCDDFGSCLPQTTFAYSAAQRGFRSVDQGSGPGASTVIALSGTDVTGDGRDDLLYTKQIGGVISDSVRLAGGSTSQTVYGAANVFGGHDAASEQSRIAYDADGDGLVDVVSDTCTQTSTNCDPSGNCVDRCIEHRAILYSSEGDGSFTRSEHAALCSAGSPTPSCSFAPLIRTVADINGDRQADALMLNSVYLGILSALGNKLALPMPRATSISGPIRHLDVDGDGDVDYLWPYPYNNGKRFDAVHVRGPMSAPRVETTPLGLDLTDDNCQIFADVNGDGLVDVVDVRARAMVRLNRGDGRYTAARDWSPSSGYPGFNGTPICATALTEGAPWLGWKRTAVFPIDYDHDGMQDLLVLQAAPDYNSYARVLVSTGSSFRVDTNTGISLGCASNPNAVPAITTLDANGDGALDAMFLCPDTSSSTGASLKLYSQEVSTVAAGRPDILTDVRDGLGALVRHVGYKLLTDLSVYTNGARFVQPLLVVSDESADNGYGTAIKIASHTYQDGTTSRDPEGWLGFRSHTITDPRTGGPRRRVTYATSAPAVAVGIYLGGRPFHPLKGRVIEDLEYHQLYTPSRVRGTRTRTEWTTIGELFPNGASDYAVAPSQTIVETFETPNSAFTPDAPFTPDGANPAITTTTTTIQVNACGDPITTTVDRGSGVTTRTTRTYSAAAGTPCDLGPSWIDFLSFESAVSTEGGASQTRDHQYVAEPDGTGRVRDTILQPSGGYTQMLCTRIVARDHFGNPSTVDITPGQCARDEFSQAQFRTRTTQTGYDTDGIHILKVTNPVGHVVRRLVHPGLGVAYSETDPNGLTTTHTFDGFGRAIRTDRPDGTYHIASYLRPGDPVPGGDLCAGGDYSNSNFAMVELGTESTGGGSVTCRDRLGRVRRVATRTWGGAYTYIDTTWGTDPIVPSADRNHPERVYQVTRPHANGAAATIAEQYTYDGPGRVTSICRVRPDATDQLAACTTTKYTKLTTDVCEPGAVSRRTVMSTYGTVQSTSIFPDATSCTTGTEAITTFEYGPFDTLTRMTDAAGNVVTQSFDALGRRTRLVDADLGSVDNTYSAFGEVMTQVDAKGVATSMKYDLIGRLLSRQAGGIDTFQWDPSHAIGQLGGANRSMGSGNSVTRAITYDAFARPSTSTLTIDGTSYTTDTTYDALGRPDTETSPSIIGLGRIETRNEYDVSGRVARVEIGRASASCSASSACQAGETCLASLGVCGRTVWTATVTDGEGRVTGEQFGNGVTTTRAFSGGYLQSITTGAVQDDLYSYGDNGSLASRTDRITGTSESFTYDGADRLRSAQVAGHAAATYQYDATSNLTAASDITAAGCAGGATFQHSKSKLTAMICGGTTWTFQHDVNGNHTNGLAGGDTYTWTPFDKLATATSAGETWSMTYDPMHARVKKQRTAGSTTPWSTIIDAGTLERRIGASGEQDVIRIAVGSAMLELTWDWNGLAGTQKLRYVHPDRLGSPEAITGDAGALVERRSFDVWGTPSAPSTNTLLGFTGHTDDIGIATGGTDFIDMGGRIYSPLLKHFWSADPYVQAPLYGPSWNRFAYTLGNPLKFTDPTGYAWNNTSSLFDYGSGGLVGQGIIRLVDEYHDQMAYEGDWAVKVHVMRDGREVATFMTPRVNLERAIADDRRQRPVEEVVPESSRRVLEQLCRDKDCSTAQAASPETNHLFASPDSIPKKPVTGFMSKLGRWGQQTLFGIWMRARSDKTRVENGTTVRVSQSEVVERELRGTRARLKGGWGWSALGTFEALVNVFHDVSHMARGEVWVPAEGLRGVFPLFGKYVPKDSVRAKEYARCPPGMVCT